MSADTLFDPGNYLVAESGTPQLEATKPNFDVVETPPPLATTRESSLAPSSGEERRAIGGRKGRRGKTKPSQSDAVVLSQLDPNRPDIAKHALKHALDSESEAEEEDSTLRPNGHQMTATITFQHAVPADTMGVLRGKLERLHGHAEEIEEFLMEDEDVEELAQRGTQPPLQPTVNGIQDACFVRPGILGSPAEIKATQKDYDTKPPPLQSPGPYRKVENESLSPALARFMTHASEADPETTLTPIQRSPPRSHSSGSPEVKQTLPSIQTALSVDSALSPFSSARSPNVIRASPANMSHYGQTPSSLTYPSPFSVRSPPTTSEPSAWRSNTSGSNSTQSDYGVTSASSMTSLSTPCSAPGPSPHHLCTPTTATSDQSRYGALEENGASPELHNHEFNGVNGNGPYANGSFLCNVKDCTAASFQTQYLLNSHMNVHSDTRPHFCSVLECPRGPGGQGFKRKNEMIR